MVQETNLFELIQKSDELKKVDRLNKKWQPRKFEEDFKNFIVELGNPEASAIQFLRSIKKGDFGTPVSLYSNFLYGIVLFKKKAGLFREKYKDVFIESFCNLNIKDVASAVTLVYIIVEYYPNSKLKSKEIDFRMIV